MNFEKQRKPVIIVILSAMGSEHFGGTCGRGSFLKINTILFKKVSVRNLQMMFLRVPPIDVLLLNNDDPHRT